MRVKTIKQYSNTYFVTFGYNGAQLGYSEAKITKDVIRSASNQAHDKFVVDTNKFRSIPTPKFDDCKFEIKETIYTEEKKYRIYTVKVTVIWQYEKE